MYNQIDPGSLYLQIGQLIATTPDLADLEGERAIPPEINRWLGEVYACVSATGEIFDSMEVRRNTGLLLSFNAAPVIMSALYRAYAFAKLRAPAAAISSFIAVGSQHDAYKAIAAVLGETKSSLLIVDPYLDHTLLRDFVPLVREGTITRLLTGDLSKWVTTLTAAATRWASQYGNSRPLEVRSISAALLHDRAI